MEKLILKAAACAAAALFLTACSEAPKPAAEPAKTEVKKEAPAGPVAAQTAYYEMYKMARQWAPDALGMTLTSANAKSMPAVDGSFPVWNCMFVSTTKNEARTFTYSVVADGTIVKGTSAGVSMAWGGATTKSRPFQNAEFQTNSDAAYKTAAEKGAEWLKANPGKKVTLELAYSAKYSTPAWTVLFGEMKSGFATFINATSGAVLNK
jgi:hypothetical protein